MNLFKADPDTDETLGMAGIAVSALMKLAHIIELRHVVLQQSADQTNHAGIRCGGSRVLDHALNRRPCLLDRHAGSLGIHIGGIQPTLKVGAAIHSRNVNTNGIGVGVDPQKQEINRGPTAKAVLDGLLEIVEAGQATAGGEGVITAMGGTALVTGVF